jgi:hypothetical protein
MLRPSALRVGSSLLAVGVLALAACNDQPTQPTTTRAASSDASGLAICGAACGIGDGGGIIVLPPPPPPPPPFSITSLSLADNTIPIGGTSGSYTAILNNIGGALSGAVLQGYITQGSARRAAGGLVVNCGGGSGVLPTGNCTMSFVVNASNTGSGIGTLVPGIATFELDLTAGGRTATQSIGLNLIPGQFTATGDVTFSLSGALGTVKTTITNTGSQTYSSYSYQMTVIQGSARRSAGAMPLECNAAGWGNLPGNTTCTQTLYPTVTNNGSGSGTLVPGFATFVVQLLHGTTVINTVQWQASILDVRFSSVTPSPNPVLIDGPVSAATYTIQNNGQALVHNGVVVSAEIRQGQTVRSTNGLLTTCVFNNSGSLPTGPCVGTVYYSAPGYAAADGQLAPGPATLAVTVTGLFVTLDTIVVPITLVR